MSKLLPEDHTLISAIKDGDRKAFRELFDRYYKLLLGTAIIMLKDSNSAKDVTQEVFLQIWKKRETLRIESSVKAYLKRAVINRSLNIIKAKKPIVEETVLQDLSQNSSSAQQILEAKDLEKAMQLALDQLPERCRLIFVMRRLEGISLKEIASQLDISPKTVENQITKALKVLKEAVSRYLEEDTS